MYNPNVVDRTQPTMISIYLCVWWYLKDLDARFGTDIQWKFEPIEDEL